MYRRPNDAGRMPVRLIPSHSPVWCVRTIMSCTRVIKVVIVGSTLTVYLNCAFSDVVTSFTSNFSYPNSKAKENTEVYFLIKTNKM